MAVGYWQNFNYWLLAVSVREDPPPSPPRGGAYIAMSYELPTVILNLVQDLTASLYLFLSADRC